MIQLFVYTADADQRAVLTAVLQRRFRNLVFKIEPHPGRDAGIVKDGPETVRSRARKGVVEKILLIWDHEGSGRETRPSEKTEADLELRLEQCTWKDRSAAIVIVPELEEWLWHDRQAVSRYYEKSPKQIAELVGEAFPASPKDAITNLHHRVFRKRKLRPVDFDGLSKLADLKLWRSSASFNRLMQILETWFPITKEQH